MTRINAGSTLANQYAPPFVVSDSVTTNWQLRYNANILAFEAFDPDENIILAGFDEIESQLFTNAVGQQTFVLPWVVDTTATNPKASLYVTINGVKQHTSTYSIAAGASTTTVVLGGPATGEVEFIGLQTIGGAEIELDNTGVGTGGASQLIVLSWLAPSEQSLLITYDGIKQNTTAYAISSIDPFTSTTVTLTPAAPNGQAIEIVGITITGETPASPVNVAKAGGGHSLFKEKTLAGETQILTFKSLVAGSGSVTITPSSDSITIDALAQTFTNKGTGQIITVAGNVVGVAAEANPVEFNALAGGDRINIALASDTLTFNYKFGREVYNGTLVSATARIVAVQNLPATVNLSATVLSDGDTITIKDEIGAAGTNNITIVSGPLIDGSAANLIINTNFGYVTLYSDGTDYFIIAQG